jgi:hypothetical protein
MAGPGKQTGVKIIALWLAIGGAVGLGLAFYSETQMFMSGNFYLTLFFAFFVVLFGGSAWAGFELWRGSPYALTLARISLALQLLNFTVPGLYFSGFLVGARVYAMIGSCRPNLAFGFDLNSMIYFRLSPDIDCWRIGVNFLALAALVYLSKAGRPEEPKQSNIGLL